MFFEDKKPHAYFYPYGVSSWERSLDIPKTKNIGCFGYYRNIDSRIVNLEMYLREIEQCEEKLHVYGDTWKEYQGEFKNVLKIHPAYSHNDTVTVMNEHKIAVNVETMWQKDVDGGLSHKLWQSIGCGIVTITNYKKSLEDIFYGSYNPVFGHPFDIAYKINHFLNDEDDLKIYGYMGEKFIHEHCEWYPRFESIMKRERIW
jgi:spore maturation protein CgeB